MSKTGGFSTLFIARPVATSLAMCALALAGLMGLRSMPVSSLPEVDYPTIQVTTLYPGASPEVASSSISAPLERQFGQMPGLRSMSSSSSGGASVVTLQFELSLSLDSAEQSVQAAINAGSNFLPADLPAPPTYAKFNPADAPIATLSASSASLPLTRVQDWVDTRLAPKLSQLPGVGIVSLGGGGKPSVRVEADPDRLASLGLSMEDLRAAIVGASANIAKGSFDGKSRGASIDANDQLRDPKDFAHIPIVSKNGSLARVSDVASVFEGPENPKLGAWDGQRRAILIDIRRQSGANVIDTARRVKELIATSAPPGDIDLRLMWDRTVAVKASVLSVSWELAFSVVLVCLAVALFLGDRKASLGPALSVPLSLLGTCAAMSYFGFSIDTLSLMALTIASGFVVDDAIVMLENISRHARMGKDPLRAAIDGAREIGFTILSLTLSLLAALIPLFFMADVAGRLFREFAATLGLAIVVSAFVSLSLSPMLAARLSRQSSVPFPTREAPGHALYMRALHMALRRRMATLFVFGLTLAASAALYFFIPKSLFPIQDGGAVAAVVDAPQSSSFAQLSAHRTRVVQRFLAHPGVVSVSTVLGLDGTNMSPNSYRVLATLKPRSERTRSASQIAQDLGDGDTHAYPTQDLTLDDSAGRGGYRWAVDASSDELLRAYAPKIQHALSELPSLRAVSTDLFDQGQGLYVEIDRDRAAQAGLTVAAIDNALYDAFGNRLVSTLFTQANVYRVALSMREADSVDKVMALRIGPVPLSSVSTARMRLAPLSIQRLNQFPSATISFDLTPGSHLGQAMTEAREAIAKLSLPANVRARPVGAAAAYEGALTGGAWLLVAAIVCVYLVLGALYESLTHPLTILSTLPSAGIGALSALWLLGKPLDIVGAIGLVLLIGIVKKNAIMLVDFAIAAQRSGMPAEEAIVEACSKRYRPILMTTAAAMLGALPLALGSGSGSEIRQPLGACMLGGLAASQLLTLLTTPAIYLFFEARFPQRPLASMEDVIGADASLSQDQEQASVSASARHGGEDATDAAHRGHS